MIGGNRQISLPSPRDGNSRTPTGVPSFSPALAPRRLRRVTATTVSSTLKGLYPVLRDQSALTSISASAFRRPASDLPRTSQPKSTRLGLNSNQFQTDLDRKMMLQPLIPFCQPLPATL